jgi:uncharacterized protein YjeT (DUF2065 family)
MPMEPNLDPTAWSALLMGLLALFAGLGAWRQPGLWDRMIKEIEHSPALQLLCGMIEILTGAVVYLANPWLPDDILTCIMKAVGGFMIAEGLAILAFCDLYLHMWLKNLGALDRRWAAVTMVWGLALAVPAMLRFG